MLPEGKCRYIDGQIYPDGNFYVLDTQHIKHNGSELKSALNSIDTNISNKVDKVAGKGLSTEDYTTAEKNKLSGIETNANNYVHPTTSGNKHIPSGGSSGKILGWIADGTAAWVDPASGGGSVDTVYIGSTEYAPDANGKVTLPTYPTTLPASDVYSWAKASSKPSYTASEVGSVPTSRTVNGKALSSNISLTYSDVDAASSGHSHSAATTSSAGFMSSSDKTLINNLSMKKVLEKNKASSATYTYTMSMDDFTTNIGGGTYLIFIITWSTAPSFSLYAVSFGGGNTSFGVTTKIAGSDATVSVSSGVISVTSSGKVMITAIK